MLTSLTPDRTPSLTCGNALLYHNHPICLLNSSTLFTDSSLTAKEPSHPPCSHYSLRIWIRRSPTARPLPLPLSPSSSHRHQQPRRESTGPLKPIYRHRLFSDEDFYIAKFPLDVFNSASINLNASLNPSGSVPVGQRFSSSRTGKGVGGGPGPGKDGGSTTTRGIVLAEPEDISDYEHVLSAKISGVSMTFVVS